MIVGLQSEIRVVGREKVQDDGYNMQNKYKIITVLAAEALWN